MVAITVEALVGAADLLGIGKEASLNEIRARYHELIKVWHPDVSREDPTTSHEMTVRLTAAYDLLCEYCSSHAVSFRPGDLARDLGTARTDYWTERFGDDPIWG